MGGGVPQEPFRRLCLDDEVRADGKVCHLIDALLHFLHGADLLALRLIQSLELFRVVIDRELAAGQFVFGVVLVHLGQGQFADGCLLGLRLGIGREVLTQVGTVGDDILGPLSGLADGPVTPDHHRRSRHIVVRAELHGPIDGFGSGDGQVVPVFGEGQSIALEIPLRENSVLVGHRRLVLFRGGVVLQGKGLGEAAVLVHEGRTEQFGLHLFLDVRHLVVDVRADGVSIHHEPIDGHRPVRDIDAVEVRVPLPDDGFPDEELSRPVLRELCPATAVLRDPGVQVAGPVVAVVQDGGDELSLPLTAEGPVPGKLAAEKVYRVPLLRQLVAGMQARGWLQTVHDIAGVVIVHDLDGEVRLHFDGPAVHEFQLRVAPVLVGVLVVRAPGDVGDLYGDRLGGQRRESDDSCADEQDGCQQDRRGPVLQGFHIQ